MKPLPKTLALLFGLTLLVALAGCKNGPQTISAAALATTEGPAQEPGKPTQVSLSEAAQKNAGIQVETGTSTGLGQTLEANGMVTANGDRTWHVGAFVPGRIAEVFVNLGDHVNDGDVLARLHTHEIHDTRAMYFQAREALRQAEARMAFAERARDRARRLLALQAISQEQTDQAETEWKSTVAATESAKAGVTRERTHLEEVLEIPFDAAGNPEDVETIKIKSPVTGVVIERKATAGSVVNSGDPLLTVSDTTSVWVIVNVNESDLSAVRPGLSAAVRVKAWPDREFSGRIQRLGESLDPTTRTLQVRVLVPNPGGLLKPEMFASVTLARPTARTAITVPRSAVQDLKGKPVVFQQLTATVFQPVPVVLGTSLGDRVEITQGLQAAARIVVAGSFALKSEMLKGSGE